MTIENVHLIDLNYHSVPQAIGVFALPHPTGVALVECGPASGLDGLQAGLGKLGYSFRDVTDVLVTHIHLDHAGASGYLAQNYGARIHVHPLGAPHLVNPEKLLSSASRIYGDRMDYLWGQVLPVPEERLSVLQDGQVIRIGDLSLRALDTPGHANHHMTYLYDGVCFSGDFGGVRLGGLKQVRLPLVPPELNLEVWRESLKKLAREQFQYIAPTHFGIFSDPDWHLEAVRLFLDGVEAWLGGIMPSNPSIEQLRLEYARWLKGFSVSAGMDASLLPAEEAANPSFMAADGLSRYWVKFRQ
jgi:glyoxylase-like metal-dependent hydrolase (beta-lactamase superfamily II)